MLFHFDFAKTGRGLSGGETCMLQLIQHAQANGWSNILGTTDHGKETYTELGLDSSESLSYRTVDAWKSEQRSLLGSYVSRTPKAMRLVASLNPQPGDALICHCDYFPTTLPFYALQRRAPMCQLVYFFHMPAPSLLRGYEGHYTGRRRIPQANVLFLHLNQWLARLLTPRRGIVVTYNECYRAYLTRRYPRNRIEVLEHFGGIERVGALFQNESKVYDVAWLGRFHAQKGLPELIDILAHIQSHKPNFRAIVIGGGTPDNEATFRKALADRHLLENVHLAGVLTGKEKYRLLSRARTFAMTSLYESFGIVTLEAMKLGLPVVAFDLPPFSVFGDGILRAPILDTEAFAQHLLDLLNDEGKFIDGHRRALKSAANFSWEKTWQEFSGFLEPHANTP